MKKELVFLVEELSAKVLLEGLLPRLLQPETHFRCIPFEGKQDLEKQLVRKIRGYQNPDARFIVMRDQDSHPDCSGLKQSLLHLCQQTGKGPQSMVRIACRELETFYLADLLAVETALAIKGIAKQQGKKKFRNPDYLGSPSKELHTLTNGRYAKVASSRILGSQLNLNNTRSPSFCNLMTGIQRMESI